MDRLRLITAFINRETVTIKGVTGVINSIQQEDGSGYSFNLLLTTKNGPKLVYHRAPQA